MIDEMIKYAKENTVPIINDEGLDFLSKQISKYKVHNILELGSAIGYSAIMMAKLSKDIHITTLEINEERYDLAKHNIHAMNMDHQINLHHIDANLFETDKMFDLIFIDLAKSQYEKMLNRYYDNLNDEGIILVDNLGMYGLVFEEHLKVRRQVRQLVEKIRLFRQHIMVDERFDVHFYDDIGDGIAILQKRSSD